MSERRLVKGVRVLGRQGWLQTGRGKGGGVRLARPAADVVLGAVVRSTEGVALVADCYAEHGGDCCIAPQCRLKDVLQEAMAAFHAVLDRYMLADLVTNGPALASILFFERPPELQAAAHRRA